MKLRHAKRALSTVAFATVASAFVSLPFSNACAEEYTVIDAAEAAQLAQLGAAAGGDEIRKIDNGDNTCDIIHIFTSVTTSSLTVPNTSKILSGTGRILVVGGGGGGGADCGGGGGAGGLIYLEDLTLSAGSIAVTVGAGGAAVNKANNTPGKDGSNSAITIAGTTYTAIGGGGGGCYPGSAGRPGGSGGGGSCSKNPGESNQPTPDVGHKGGTSGGNLGGGGGGAGGVGGATNGNNAGAGGAGLPYDISGETKWYAAGGGGGAQGGAYGEGGSGIGGRGGKNAAGLYSGEAGTPGTGSGGGGAGGGTDSGQKGAAGGSGVVIVRYTIPAPQHFDVNGADVFAMAAEGTKIGDELVLRFTDPTMTGSLILPRYVQAWILKVGGGGAGANPGAAAISLAGAAGGGAGGFVEDTNASLSAGTYAIMVGAGGLSPNAQGLGGNGGDSYISLDGAVIGTVAKGGGGGGYRSVGSAGGSGGGGSKANGGAGTLIVVVGSIFGST